MSVRIEKNLNPYLSNLAIMFVKLHDLHWNVKGKMFIQVHEHAESLYDEMAEKLDEVAEKIIMKGAKPVSKMNEYLELATIKKLTEFDYSDVNVLREILEDIKILKEQAVAIRNEFAELDEFTVTMMLEDHIAGYEKEIWFLESMTK